MPACLIRRSLLTLALCATAASQDVAPPSSVVDWARQLEVDTSSLGLRFDIVEHEGLRDSRDDVSRTNLFAQGYTAYTSELTRSTTTVHFARGLEECTLFGSLPLVDVERSVDLNPAGAFDQEASGIGDLQVGLTRTWEQDENDHVVWSIAANLPTGSTDERDAGVLVPYALQPGSGTFDLLPGVAWTRHGDEWTGGAALRGRIHLGRNSDDWARSDSQVLDAWIGRALGEDLTGRLQLRYSSWGDVHGGAAGLNPAADPLADDNRQGGARTDLLVGFDWAPGDGDTTLGLELGVPIDEWLDGPQASADFIASVGIRFGW